MGIRAVVLCLPLLCLGSVAQAQSAEIDGAFGLSLGATFTADQAKRTLDEEGAGRGYVVGKPPKPYEPLDEYTVRVTGDDRIYEVVGSGTLASAESCAKEQEYITGVIAEKYGATAQLRGEDALIRRNVLRRGERSVEIVCVGRGLDVRYSDPSLLSAGAGQVSEAKAGASQANKPSSKGRDTSAL